MLRRQDQGATDVDDGPSHLAFSEGQNQNVPLLMQVFHSFVEEKDAVTVHTFSSVQLDSLNN